MQQRLPLEGSRLGCMSPFDKSLRAGIACAAPLPLVCFRLAFICFAQLAVLHYNLSIGKAMLARGRG